MKNKRVLFVIASLLTLAGVAVGQMRLDPMNFNRGVKGWQVRAENTAIGTTDTLLARDTAYKQMSVQDSLEIVCDTVDTVRVVLTVVMPDSTRRPLIITVNGQDTARTTVKPLFLESVFVDSGLALTDTLRVFEATSNTHLTQVEPNHVTDYVAHFFLTKRLDRVKLKRWFAGVTSTTGTVDFYVRYYRDWEDARLPGEGAYIEVDHLALTNVLDNKEGNIKEAILSNIGAGRGWIGIFTVAGSGGADGYGGMDIHEF